MMLSKNNKSCEQTALKFLAIRSYSEKELSQKLKQRGYAAEEVASTIASFRKRGYLNDTALCLMLLNKYSSTGKLGLSGIIVRMKQRGIPNEIINAVTYDYDDNEDFNHALKLINCRFPDATPEHRPKIARYLASRGFKPDAIMRVLEQLENHLQD
jgi:regulatory protein